jgi:hypothetical protein
MICGVLPQPKWTKHLVVERAIFRSALPVPGGLSATRTMLAHEKALDEVCPHMSVSRANRRSEFAKPVPKSRSGKFRQIGIEQRACAGKSKWAYPGHLRTLELCVGTLTVSAVWNRLTLAPVVRSQPQSTPTIL